MRKSMKKYCKKDGSSYFLLSGLDLLGELKDGEDGEPVQISRVVLGDMAVLRGDEGIRFVRILKSTGLMDPLEYYLKRRESLC